MAKLKAFVAKLEDVPEAQRDLYVEDTDDKGNKRFKLDADGVEDVTGLKNTVAALRKENKTLKDRTAVLDDIEPDQVEEIITAGREAIEAQKSGKPRPEVEAVRAQMARENKKVVDKLQARLDGAIEALHEGLIVNLTDAEVRRLGGSPGLIKPAVKEKTKIVETEENGKIKFRAAVFDENGTERTDNKGKPFDVKALIAEMADTDEYSGAFPGTGMSGSDTPTDGGARTATPPRTPTAPAGNEARAAKRRSGDYSQI